MYHECETALVIDEYQGDQPIDVAAVQSVWELARPHEKDGRCVETNLLMAYAYGSNSNVQLLGGEVALNGIVRYVVGYCSKNPSQLNGVVPMIMQVLREVRAMDNSQDDEHAIHLRELKRMINAIDRKVEFSAQMCAMALLAGLGRQVCGKSLKLSQPTFGISILAWFA